MFANLQSDPVGGAAAHEIRAPESSALRAVTLSAGVARHARADPALDQRKLNPFVGVTGPRRAPLEWNELT